MSSNLIARSVMDQKWQLAYDIELSVAYASCCQGPCIRRGSSAGRARD
ncbi:MAG: hypothetical protein ABTQ25_09475 [Nitrosomonas ureae]